MSKNNYYSVKYTDNTGRIFTNFDDYQAGIKGHSGSSSRGFRQLADAEEWLAGRSYKLVKTTEPNLIKQSKVEKSTDKKKSPKKTRYYVVAKGKRRGIYTDITKYQKYSSSSKDMIAKGGFKNKEQAKKWLERVTKNQKKYHAIVIGKRAGIYTDKKKFDNNLKGIKNSWGKDNFKSREDAQKWFDERTAFIRKYKNSLYKEVIVAYESKSLPVIYVDGSYFPHRKRYSSSVVICEKSSTIATFAKAEVSKKNNIDGEVEALLFALKLVIGLYEFKEFILVYDFDDLEKVARNQMKIRGVTTAVQEQIVENIDTYELNIHFLNVKSHNGIIGNIVADKIARNIIDSLDDFDSLRTFNF
ncbi:viroplasmin family protein [Enterococcus sp. AZ072]|uniref:ribonuclease H1 domain-containing protein n=1 Tax=unclassified Enterococcus TaxID=2608891 RepID=UPI003D2B583D